MAALRTGLVLTAVAAGTDWLFAAIGGHGGPATSLEGLVLTGLALAGVTRPELAARALCPPGRATLCAAAFAVGGAIDLGLQTHFAQVAPAILFLAAVVSSTRCVTAALAVSVAGYLGDLALAGRSTSWIVVGAGASQVVTQLVDLVLNAVVGLLLIALLRRFFWGTRAMIDAVRAGGVALTPDLAAAVAAGREPRPLLRADPEALTSKLTSAEREVIALLASGLAPKQAAYELHLALSTVRSHIAAAKRKTGARTLEQLVATFAEAQVARR